MTYNIKQSLRHMDMAVYQALCDEERRQETQLELIASENFASRAVMEACGSVFTNKYAEGYPYKRYYGGCENMDMVEQLAIQRACELFQCEYANVQPHSGAQANQAVFLALLTPGDTILGMDLNHGGHLTHGSKVNLSGKWFKTSAYGVDLETGLIDMKKVATLAKRNTPKIIIAGASAYARVIDFAAFREIADSVGAYLMVDMAHYAGLIAAGVYPSPLPYAHVVTSTTHKTLRGPRGGIILSNDPALGKKFNSAVFPGLQGGPLMHIIAGKAVAFKEALEPSFIEYAQQVIKNARALAKTLTEGGLKIVSDGTDSHLVLVDLTPLDIAGATAEEVLEKAGLTCNKNSIPGDKRPPMETSGIRLGSPALTTRGLQEKEFRQVGKWILEALQAHKDDTILETLPKIRSKVANLCEAFPLYQ